ncbi:MAG: SURF1 family protein [Actinomycetota bacterium]
MTRKGLAWFTVFTLAALALLIGLGLWQLRRLEWKEGLLAEIEARAKGAPITLRQAVDLARAGKDPSYYRVQVKGGFENDKERYLYALSNDGKLGWHVITPFDTVDGDLVLIDRGFVPDDLRNPSTRAAGELQGEVDVTGLVRLPETPGPFTPDNEPNANQWFWRDLNGMTFSMFPTATTEPAPFFLEAEKSDVPGGWPQGGQTRLELPNNHLQYAITWFLLAAAVLIIYVVFVWGAYPRKKD